MPREPGKHLRDMLDAAEHIQSFVRGLDAELYCEDLRTRRAVEREFTVLGEALARPTREFPDEASRLPDVSAIRAFRNRLVHQYDAVDDVLVFGIIEGDLPPLIEQLRRLMSGVDGTSRPGMG